MIQKPSRSLYNKLSSLLASLPCVIPQIISLHNKHLLTFIGLSGSGKSTIINHLLSNQLVRRKINGMYHIVHEPEIKSLELTSQSLSCSNNSVTTSTSYPIINTFNKSGSQVPHSPSLYSLPSFSTLLLCDTQGHYSGKDPSSSSDILHQLYLNACLSLVSIIFVISKSDIESQKGGALHQIYDELEKIIVDGKGKESVLFIVNYKNKERDEYEELFEQMVRVDEQVRGKYESKQYVGEMEKPKVKLFEIMFGKSCYKDKPKFESFKERVLICSREDLLSDKSLFKKEFLQKIQNKITQGHSLPSFQFSFEFNQLLVLLRKDTQKRKDNFRKSLMTCQGYHKKKILEAAIMLLLTDNQKISNNPGISKQKIVNNLMFKTDQDVNHLRQLVEKITQELKQKQGRKDKLRLIQQNFTPHPYQIQQIQKLQISLRSTQKIVLVVKKIEGFDIISEDLRNNDMFYTAVLLPNQWMFKRAEVRIYTSYEELDKQVIRMLMSEKEMLEDKIKSLEIASMPEVREGIKKAMQEICVRKFTEQKIAEYGIELQQFITGIPDKSEIETLQNQLFVLKEIGRRRSQLGERVLGEVFEQECLGRFKRLRVVNYKGKEGYCAVNWHLIEEVVWVECGHHVERMCWDRGWIEGKSKEGEKKQEKEKQKEKEKEKEDKKKEGEKTGASTETGIERIGRKCLVCGEELRERKGTEEEEERMRELRKAIFRAT